MGVYIDVIRYLKRSFSFFFKFKANVSLILKTYVPQIEYK